MNKQDKDIVNILYKVLNECKSKPSITDIFSFIHVNNNGKPYDNICTEKQSEGVTIRQYQHQIDIAIHDTCIEPIYKITIYETEEEFIVIEKLLNEIKEIIIKEEEERNIAKVKSIIEGILLK